MTSPITMTMAELDAAQPALTRLLAQRLPARAAYHLAKLARLLTADLQYLRDHRAALFQEFGQPSGTAPDGSTFFTIPPEHRDAFGRRWREVMAVPVEIAWTPLAFDVLGEITPEDLLALGPLVADPVEAVAAPAAPAGVSG